MKKILSLYIFSSLLLLACSGPIQVADQTYTIPTAPEFRGEVIEKYKLSSMPLSDAIILDSVQTAWRGAKGEILIFNHQLKDEINRIEGKKTIDALVYAPADFYWTESDISKRYVRFAAESGKEVWRIEGKPTAAGPAVFDSLVFFPAVNGEINALSIDSAKSIWTTRLNGRIFLDPLVVDDNLIVITDKGDVHSLAADSGEEIWKFSFEQPILVRKIQEGIAYIGTFRGDMIAFDLTEQEVLWQVPTDHQVRNQPLVVDSTVYWANTGGDIFRINRQTGEFKQIQSLQIPLSGLPVQTNSGILFAGEDKLLYHIHKDTGKILSKTEFDGRLRSTPLYIQNSWFIAIEDRWLYEVQ